jgi:hypothetical protein
VSRVDQADRMLMDNKAPSTVTITVELEPHEAAALFRLCDKFAHSDAKQYLYPHSPKQLRDDQAYHMVHATSHVHTALTRAGVSAWPWVETGGV